jgi:YHS domain-containing protein/thioredoxin-related protein
MSQSNVGRFPGGDADWRRLVMLTVGLFIVLLATTSRVVGAEPSFWRQDFKTALTEAEEKRLPLLVHFYADWCMPCQRMEREVFPTPAVREVLGNRFVAVKVNSDHRQDLVRRYGVETLPSDVVVDSLSGRVIAVYSGFQDRVGYLANASQAEARFISAHASELVVTKSVVNTDTAQPAVGVMSNKIELGEAQPVVGLDGFSPVALVKKRQWNRGSPRLAWDYKDVTYHFSNRDELVEFRNNPEAYAPRLLGCDPVILWEQDKAVAGDIRFGAFFDDELFLFKSDDRRKQFKANPEKFIRLQHALKADQIERTVMR